MSPWRALIAPLVVGLLFLQANCADQENPAFPDKGDDADGGDPDGSIPPPQPAQEHPNRNPQPKVVECSRPALTAPSSGTCAVTKSGAGSIIYRGTVLTPNEVLRRGEVVVDDEGIILCAACDCSASAGYAAASLVTCADGVISPGMINPHEHLTYQNNRPVGHGDLRYQNRSDWQGGRGHQRLDYKSGANQTVQAFGELRFLMSGTTSITGAGGVPGLMRNVDRQIDLLEGLPSQIARTDVFPLGSPGKNLTSGCDYTSPRTSSTVAQLESYLPHISEGIDSEARNEFVCLSQGDHDVVERPTAIIHVVALTPADAAVVRADMAKVVWSPRSNVDLYGDTAAVVMMDMAGVNLSLGTDWIPSGSMNMLRELRCADELNQRYYDKHFTDADLWRMATENGAFAVGGQHAIGMLKRGYLADIAIFDGKTSKDHRAVIEAGVEDVVLVLRGGKAMYGDAALVQSPIFGPGTGCDVLAGGVCGRQKVACMDARIGGANPPDLATVRAAGEAIYPLFFCKDKVPDDEPSCHPFRGESVKGSSTYDGTITEDDQDGDGIPDELDNCPTIFNPVRPMDGGRQADADLDGIGDACDPCPLNEGTEDCAVFTGADLDNDGVPNGVDNCPEKANPDQADGDKDGRGDACDSCEQPNPGAVPCELPIATIRNPAAGAHPSPNTIVRTQGYISARRTSPNPGMFYLQTNTTAAPWEGIYVPVGAAVGTATNGPRIGDRITVTGVYREAFQVSEIIGAQVRIDSGRPDPVATLVPITVTAAQINTAAGASAEPYESVLLRLEGPVTILNDNPDSGPFHEFIVTGNLRIDDLVNARHGAAATCGGMPCGYPSFFDPGQPGSQDNPRKDFTAGQVFTSITGIGGFSFGNRKLYPRVNTAAATDLPRP
jgi:cytosine/adenosine deaminase-related metal-dependent hydrolase